MVTGFGPKAVPLFGPLFRPFSVRKTGGTDPQNGSKTEVTFCPKVGTGQTGHRVIPVYIVLPPGGGSPGWSARGAYGGSTHSLGGSIVTLGGTTHAYRIVSYARVRYNDHLRLQHKIKCSVLDASTIIA